MTDILLLERSSLFSRLSNLAYKEPATANKVFKKMGYTSTFYENKGSNVYVLEDMNDIIVVCRGTETNEWSDIRADLSINLAPSRAGNGKVHRGFRTYTDHVWDQVKTHVLQHPDKKLWLTGHSLGAAMATLMARRFVLDPVKRHVEALFTFGSPRVGDRKYINEFNDLVTHYRWVNDGDIVTKIPFSPWYYHCGTKYHLTQTGIFSEKEQLQKKILLIGKLVLGFWKGVFNMITSDAKDHSSDLYAQRLNYWFLNTTT
jgi:triacylglycerol lipase